MHKTHVPSILSVRPCTEALRFHCRLSAVLIAVLLITIIIVTVAAVLPAVLTRIASRTARRRAILSWSQTTASEAAREILPPLSEDETGSRFSPIAAPARRPQGLVQSLHSKTAPRLWPQAQAEDAARIIRALRPHRRMSDRAAINLGSTSMTTLMSVEAVRTKPVKTVRSYARQ